MKRIIFHIDVNNAFLSWSAVEELKNGGKVDYRKIPSVIGGNEKTRSGIVLAKSPVAKQMGIVTPEALYSARKKCKDLVVIPPNYNLYEKMSNQFVTLLKNYSPLVEQASVDECYLDYTGMEKLFGDPIKLAFKIKEEIKTKYGFTVNVGVANNKLCAKMASELTKPDKLHTMFDEEIEEKMWPLPIGDLFSLGKVTAAKLKNLGLEKIGDLAQADSMFLKKHLKNNGLKLKRFANGIDTEKVIPNEERDPCSISCSRTTTIDMKTKEEAFKLLSYLSFEVGKQLRKKEFYAGTIAISIKNTFFETKSCQIKLSTPINLTDDIFKNSKKLFVKLWEKEKLRLISITLTNFQKTYEKQISFFDKKEEGKNKKLQSTIDNINNKYGKDIIKKI